MSTTIPILPESDQIVAARSKWRFDGSERPDFAEPTAAREESVWDYPRPPVIQPVRETLRVFRDKDLIAQTERGVRVLETASPPTYYFPPEDVEAAVIGDGGQSLCEWKGVGESLTIGGSHAGGDPVLGLGLAGEHGFLLDASGCSP